MSARPGVADRSEEVVVSEVVRERGLVATMDDGVGLVADAWHPEGSGPWPVLLQRLPYGRSVASAPVLPSPVELARRGYAVVVQDVRGRGDSEGVFEPFVNEATDGAATVEWAAALPFSNGDVVTYGYSYQGLVQLLAAARRPPSLRGVAAMMCGSEPYEGWTYLGGCLQWSFVATWAAQLAAQEPGATPRRPDLDALPIAAALGGDPPPWFRAWLDHPDDDAFWAAVRPDLGAIDVPVFSVVGYFDQFAAATARLVAAIGAEAVCGPWAHMPWGTHLGGAELGVDAGPAPAITAFLRFCDRILLGAPPGGTPDRGGRPVRPDPPSAPARVRWYSLDGGWRDAPRWPPPGTMAQWTAVSGGGACSRHGDGRLVAGAADPGPPDVVVAEPLVPHPGDLDPWEQVAAAEDRRDVACYTSPPLAEALDLAGSAILTARVRADAATFDLIASLVRVDPADDARRLATGARRVVAVRPDRTAAGGGDPGIAVGHHTAVVTVEIGPLAWHAQPGQRLRLDVSASRFPAFDRNPQRLTVGGPPGTGRPEHRVATIELLDVRVELPCVGPTRGADVGPADAILPPVNPDPGR